MTRTRTFAVALATAGLVVVPSAASAKTIIGSGSSVAEPYLRALFAGYHKVEPKVKFVYTANSGNAGVKDVQQRPQPVRGPDAPAAALATPGTTYSPAVPRRAVHRRQPGQQAQQPTIARCADIFLGNVTNWSAFPARA